MRISDRRGFFGRNEVKQKGGKSRGIKAYRLLCPIRSQCCTNYNAPTGNLDSCTSQDVMGLLKTTSTKFSQTIVMITHNEEIAQLADRIIRIEDGRIVTGKAGEAL